MREVKEEQGRHSVKCQTQIKKMRTKCVPWFQEVGPIGDFHKNRFNRVGKVEVCSRRVKVRMRGEEVEIMKH